MSLNSLMDKAMKALNPFEFKIFWFVFRQTEGENKEWARITQDDMETGAKVSHPTALKYVKILKGQRDPFEGDEEGNDRQKWIKVRKVTYPSAYGRLYALDEAIVLEFRRREEDW